MGKYFCSDGLRGVVNERLLPLHVYKVGRVIGAKCTRKAMVIGRDTRLSCDLIESAFIAGAAASGAAVYRAGVIPTNAIAVLTKENGFEYGIMVTASHNSFENNGIKIFDADGEKISESFTQEIEAYLDGDDTLPFASAENIGQVFEYHRGRDLYIEYLKSKIQCSANNLNIGLDCANGTASEYVKRIFAHTGAGLHIIHDHANGRNINDRCGATCPEEIRQFVLREKLDMGFAFDGDADRCIAVDECGNLIDGDRMLYILSKFLNQKGELIPKLACATEMSNTGVKVSLNSLGISCKLSLTGDHALYDLMKQEHCMIGAERIGHIIVPRESPSSDGMLTALMLINAAQYENKKLSELLNGYQDIPQILYSIPTVHKQRLTEDASIQALVHSIRSEIGENGRVVFRPSGIDNMVRILVECEDKAQCNAYADQIKQSCLAALQRIEA